MLRIVLKILAVIALAGINVCAVASQTSPQPVNAATNNPASKNQPGQNPIITLPYLPHIKFQQQYCPPVNQLVKQENLHWHAPPDWKSYTESFANVIGHFAGAQWQGVNVGKILCVYTAKDKSTFPIVLEREMVVPTPLSYQQRGVWKEGKAGALDCNSPQITDCPFLVEIPAGVTDPYQELESFKKSP